MILLGDVSSLLTLCKGYARAINPRVQAGEAWTWRMTSPALLASAVQRHGWSFLPNHVLPPLLANTVVGAVLYTSYLQTVGLLHEPSSRATRRVDPLPPPSKTFAAGFIAGSIQSLLAAPLDALQVRFKATDMMNRKYDTIWQYAYRKTSEIGARGVFAGWTLSFFRDAFGNVRLSLQQPAVVFNTDVAGRILRDVRIRQRSSLLFLRLQLLWPLWQTHWGTKGSYPLPEQRRYGGQSCDKTTLHARAYVSRTGGCRCFGRASANPTSNWPDTGSALWKTDVDRCSSSASQERSLTTCWCYEAIR